MALPDLMKANENYGHFQIYNLIIQNDRYGAYASTYVPGAIFEGVLVLDDSINARIAEKQGVTGLYQMTFEKELYLPWHTVIKKIDGEKLVGTFFRVTSKDENATPSSTPLNLRKVIMEEYVPSGDIENG
jgi:hypothetical protein